MQFSELIDQEETKKKLTGLVENNRLSHALLFLGREGCGSLPLAIAFAQYILCEQVNPPLSSASAPLFGEEELPAGAGFPADSCGKCPSCIKARQLIHPDLHFTYPALKRSSGHDKVLSTDYIGEWRVFIKDFPYHNAADWINFLKESPSAKIDSPVNKQGNITVAECDDISRKLSLKPFESRYKILIIWMPEFLGAAGNKLLKLIEEPPPDTLFIFVAEDESAILPTILSRLQLIKIPSLPNKAIETALVSRYEVHPQRAAQLAAVSEGNLREALIALHDSEEDLQKQLRDWLNVIVKNNVREQIKWIDELSKAGREKQKQLLKYFIHLIRLAIRISYLPKEVLFTIPEKELDFAFRLSKICTNDMLEAMANEAGHTIYYIERNAYAKTLFHALTIRFFHIIKDNSLLLVH